MGTFERITCMTLQDLDWKDPRYVLTLAEEDTLSSAARRIGDTVSKWRHRSLIMTLATLRE